MSPHLCTFLIAIGFGSLWMRQSADYLPLTPQQLGAPFGLRQIGTLASTSPALAAAVGPKGSRLTVVNGRLELEGRDSHDKLWSVDLVELAECAHGSRAYESDLDRDGVTDLILVTPTCGNGLAPTNIILAVTFDTRGRPLPFEAPGYSNVNDRGIDTLVDLDRNGKADLIFMNFDDGYWITNLYAVDRARWHRITGRFAGNVFPMYTRFTNAPNTRAVTPPADRHPWAPDLSNVDSRLSGSLIEWHWPDRTTIPWNSSPADFPFTLTVAGSDGRHTACVAPYASDSTTLILDEVSGRQVIHLSRSNQSRADSMLARIVSDALHVRLFGRREPNRCSPQMIWATSQQ